MNPLDFAFHESGHCVTAHHLGFKIGWLSLTGCQVDATWGDDLDKFLCAVTAGNLAAHLKNPALPPEPWAGDIKMVEWAIKNLNDGLAGYIPHTQNYWQVRLMVAQDQAKKILHTHWAAVDRLAFQLCQERYLTGAQVEKIIQAR